MPKLRSSDSGTTSRTRLEVPRPISTGTAGSHNVSKGSSSPHNSISRMFSTKIRELLHTRDRRASSPLSPVVPIVSEARADSLKPSSASVPSSPRVTHLPVVQPVYPDAVTQTPTEDYGMIPISNPFPQCGKDYAVSVAEPPSGHSSYMSMDSPTSRTESTSQDSSTSTESTGILSNRSSFRSFQEEGRRSRSPVTPITPSTDYQHARTTPERTNTIDSVDRLYEDAQDDAQSQEVPVFLDERSEVPNPTIPSVQIEAASPIVSKHKSDFPKPSPPRVPQSVSRSRSVSPATRRTPSSVTPAREEYTGRETPSFLTPRPAPIPIGSAKPALRPTEGGSKPLRSNTISSRSSAANSSRAPVSLTPRVRKNLAARPSTASRPGTSLSAMTMASNGSAHSPKMPGSPREGDLSEIDETVLLGAPKILPPAFNPDDATAAPSIRGKPGSLKSTYVPRERATPPAFDARSFRTAPGSPTAPSEYSFTIGLSPKRIPDDMQMSPTVFHTEGSDADVSIPEFLPRPSPVMETRRLRLRHALTRLNSHVNKRGATPHITPDIISRPSTATKSGISAYSTDVPATIPEYNNPGNLPPTSRPRATSSANQQSGSSFSRWKSAHTRSSSNPSNPPPPAYSLPAASTLAPGVPQPVALTEEEQSRLEMMPGMIFLKTSIKTDGPDGELIQEHRLKPRKGMQDSGAAGKCKFCRRGPLPNMWVCLDSCGFVMCRVCANESVHAGEAELR